MAPLAQRLSSPPGGPRPAPEPSDESEGRGVEAPALGKPESAEAPLLLRGTGGALIPGLGIPVPPQKGRALRWVCPFPPSGLPAWKRAPESGILFPKIHFVCGDPGSRSATLLPGRGSGRLGFPGWGSRCCLHPRGGGGPREWGLQGGGSSHRSWAASRLAHTRVRVLPRRSWKPAPHPHPAHQPASSALRA